MGIFLGTTHITLAGYFQRNQKWKITWLFGSLITNFIPGNVKSQCKSQKTGIICLAELSTSNWDYNKCGRTKCGKGQKKVMWKNLLPVLVCIYQARICLGLNMVTLFALFYYNNIIVSWAAKLVEFSPYWV